MATAKRITSRSARSKRLNKTSGTGGLRGSAADIGGSRQAVIDYLLSVMHDPSAPDDRRQAAAVALLPYFHAKLKPVEYQPKQEEIDLSKFSKAEREWLERLGDKIWLDGAGPDGRH